jgi:uncharacterized protein (DUF1810 family)
MTDLTHFVTAQAPIYPAVLAELRAGRKRTHWMWFVFPQLRGLGRSETARYYGIIDLAEAREYLAHPLLGARLRECAGVVLAVEGRSAVEIFGEVDALKFRSSVTLFGRAAPAETLYRQAIEKYYDGIGDPATLELLG